MGISYRIVGGLRFYDRREIKDCIAYLRLLVNPLDLLAFERVINVPHRGIGSVTITQLREFIQQSNMNCWEAVTSYCSQEKSRRSIRNQLLYWKEQVIRWQNLASQVKPRALLQTIVDEVHLEEFLRKDSEADVRLENLREFLNSLDDFTTLEDFLTHISLVNDLEMKGDSFDGVNIMTIHAAKGLEFGIVFLPNWQEGIFPNPRSLEEDTNGLEEERRLAYVAITRARHLLYLSYSRWGYDFGGYGEASRFIAELPSSSIHIQDHFQNSIGKFTGRRESVKTVTTLSKKSPFGQQRCHNIKFGDGTVMAERDGNLVVIFDKWGERIIRPDFVKFLEN
jgi:DNA helicase-2/ATP-dependent DNA helicase PcrA